MNMKTPCHTKLQRPFDETKNSPSIHRITTLYRRMYLPLTKLKLKKKKQKNQSTDHKRQKLAKKKKEDIGKGCSLP